MPQDERSEETKALDRYMEETGADEGGETQESVPGGDTDKPAVETQLAVEPKGKEAVPAEAKKQLGKQRGDGLFEQDDGSIIDAQGNVIAASGKERRVFESNKAVARENASLKERLAVLEASAGSPVVAGMNEAKKKYNLDDKEILTGVALAARFKTDPVSTIKYILTQAKASGHNVDAALAEFLPAPQTTIRGGQHPTSQQPAGITAEQIAAVVERAVAARMQPLTTQQDAATAAKATETELEGQISAFYGQYPDAPLHEGAIAQIVAKGASMEAAYFQLKMFATENGLDWDKPLQPQVVAMQAEKGNGKIPLPSGNAGSGDVTPLIPEAADPDESWTSIVGRAMQAQGLKMN